MRFHSELQDSLCYSPVSKTTKQNRMKDLKASGSNRVKQEVQTLLGRASSLCLRCVSGGSASSAGVGYALLTLSSHP